MRDLIIEPGSLRLEGNTLTVGVRMPWYRALPLSSVCDLVLEIDGFAIDKASTKWLINGVNYRGAGQAVNDVMAGRVDYYFSPVAPVLAQIKEGQLRALAVGSAKRSGALTDIPTTAEAGVPGYEATSWFGLSAPAGTPSAVVTRLNSAIVKVLAQADVKKKIYDQGADVFSEKPEQFASFIQAESLKWGKVVRDSGASLD